MSNWILTVDDRIATLTLNRAEHRNILTPDTLQELRELTAEIKKNDGIWAVVLRGDGAHFSVGVDVGVIGDMVGSDKTSFAENLRQMQACLNDFEALPQPTIASIRGYCVGGGIILSLCCDFRIVSANTQFALTEVKRGIAVLMGTHRITRTIGLSRTKELTMLGNMINADTAYTYGLVNRVVPDDALEDETATFAANFRELPPLTVRICKQIAELSAHGDTQDIEIERQSSLLDTADFQEGVASFFEKRPPKFTGR